MKKIMLSALLLTTSATFYAKPSLGTRTYHATKGTIAGALIGLGGLAVYERALDTYTHFGGKDYTIEIFGNNVDLKPLALTSYASGTLAALLGIWKLGSIMKNSFQKAFGSSELLEVTRGNYKSAVIESDKPVVLAILPKADELSNSVRTTLTALHKELHKTYTFGTIEPDEATTILDIHTPSVLFIKQGNKVAKHEGIYNKEQLSNLIKSYGKND